MKTLTDPRGFVKSEPRKGDWRRALARVAPTTYADAGATCGGRFSSGLFGDFINE